MFVVWFALILTNQYKRSKDAVLKLSQDTISIVPGSVVLATHEHDGRKAGYIHTPLCHDRPDVEHTAGQRLDRSALGLIGRSYNILHVSFIATRFISRVYSLQLLHKCKVSGRNRQGAVMAIRFRC